MSLVVRVGVLSGCALVDFVEDAFVQVLGGSLLVFGILSLRSLSPGVFLACFWRPLETLPRDVLGNVFGDGMDMRLKVWGCSWTGLSLGLF